MITRRYVICDAEDCQQKAAFRITHEMLDTYPMKSNDVIEVDLCEDHATDFVMTGRGYYDESHGEYMPHDRDW